MQPIFSAQVARQRLPVWIGLAGVCALAWAYTVWHAVLLPMDGGSGMAASAGMGGSAGMAGMAGSVAGMAMAMPRQASWDAVALTLTFAMWAVMMVAMMVPAAAPMILLFATVHRRQREGGHAAVPTAVFLAGYLAVWSAFSALATSAQWGLHEAALLSPMLAATRPWLGGGLLIAAGVYQWTPLKQACLAKCRSPLGFLLTEWREGVRGALVMGVRHGGYCTGCCWALMALLFVGGVMNLVWVAALAVVVLGEKVLPRGALLGKAGGLGLIGWGAWVVARGLS